MLNGRCMCLMVDSFAKSERSGRRNQADITLRSFLVVEVLGENWFVMQLL